MRSDTKALGFRFYYFAQLQLALVKRFGLKRHIAVHRHVCTSEVFLFFVHNIITCLASGYQSYDASLWYPVKAIMVVWWRRKQTRNRTSLMWDPVPLFLVYLLCFTEEDITIRKTCLFLSPLKDIRQPHILGGSVFVEPNRHSICNVCICDSVQAV